MSVIESGDLNHDPEPWVARPQFRSEIGAPKHHAGSVECATWCVKEPRPEFDHAQHNEPNPILVAFRGWLVEPIDLPDAAQWWLAQMTDGTREPLSSAYRAMRETGANATEYDHARRVLTRLADLNESTAVSR